MLLILILILIVAIRRERGRESDRTQESQVMHNTIAHHLLTDTQAIPKPVFRVQNSVPEHQSFPGPSLRIMRGDKGLWVYVSYM